MKISHYLLILICVTLTNSSIAQTEGTFSYLALGDSYTKGAGVCNTCGFPELLKTAVEERSNKKVILTSIAENGWTTADLKNNLTYAELDTDYDLVTLLIGVNNQYQGLSFAKFKREFPEIIDNAIAAAQGDPRRVIVLSIPDYAYTPSTYGASNQNKVTEDIDKYNEWVKFITKKRGAYYSNITKFTRLGIADPTLVAKDGLHPSAQSHSRFMDVILPKVKKILKY